MGDAKQELTQEMTTSTAVHRYRGSGQNSVVQRVGFRADRSDAESSPSLAMHRLTPQASHGLNHT